MSRTDTPAVLAIPPTLVGDPERALEPAPYTRDPLRDTTPMRYCAPLMSRTLRVSRGAREAMKETLSLRRDDALLREFTELRLSCHQPRIAQHTLQAERHDPLTPASTAVHTDDPEALDLTFRSRRALLLTLGLLGCALCAALLAFG